MWNRRVAMRDGVEVAADVMLPPGEGPWPAVVTRTPYMRGRHLDKQSWMRLVDHGYAYVAVDVRGRVDSDGAFVPFVHDAEDGHDTIEWVAEQPWCTGRVGMVGSSYEGLTQWWTAKGRPPHLRCIVPQAMGVASLGPRPSMDTGVPFQYWIWWFNLVTGRTTQHSGAPSWGARYDSLPLRSLDEQVGTSRDHWPRYVAGEIDLLGPDHALTAEDWAELGTPALIGVGWWDDQNTMSTWMALKDSPAGPRSRLLIGAWDHAGNLAPRPTLGGMDVSASVCDVIGYIERFLALHLKEDAAAEADLSRCRIFRTGEMKWETLDDWPSPEAAPVSWHLDADGGLSTEPAQDDGEDSYVYDPDDPVRDFSNLDMLAWSDPPLDSRYLLRRKDVLVFTSAPLEQRVDASGHAIFEGFVSADCPDTDLIAELYDIHPDGRAIVLGSILGASLRLAYRNGPEAEPLQPGEPAAVRLPLTWMHHSLLPGHRIALSLTSSRFPFLARNRNTGEAWPDVTESRIARVTIHRGPAHPSRLVLPVEPAR
jgi:putative CocE/NonD family hydrolase